MDATRCLLRLFGDETECNVRSIAGADATVVVELTPPLKLPQLASASAPSSLSTAAADMVARLANTASRRQVFDGAFGPTDSQDHVCNSLLQDLVPRYWLRLVCDASFTRDVAVASTSFIHMFSE